MKSYKTGGRPHECQFTALTGTATQRCPPYTLQDTTLAFCYLFLQNLQSLFEKLLGLEGASALYREDKVVLDQVNLDAIGPFRIVEEIANSCCQASRSRIRYDRDLIERNT